jgi:predicted dithiol-disulfide oxidoreductase (DUF899 family)
MGWRFPWVSFTPEQLGPGRAVYNYRETALGLADQSGDSLFYKDEAGGGRALSQSG